MVKDKKRFGLSWWSDWTLLWIFGGFILTYFIYIPVTGDRVHPEHWLFSIVGGVAGYSLGFFTDTGLRPVVRFVRRSRKWITLKHDRETQARRRR